MADRAYLERLQKELADKGLLIAAGFAGYRLGVMPLDAPPIQLEETKMAFFAGAHHLYQSMMAIMDPGDDPTTADLDKMEKIHNELTKFAADLELRQRMTIANIIDRRKHN